MSQTEPKIHHLGPEKFDLFRAEMKAKFEKTGKIIRATVIKNEHGEMIGFDFPCEDGSFIRVGPTFYPWISHERHTWPYRYMTTKEPMTMRIWNGKHPVDDNTTMTPLPIGTRVKIVMVSRLGDVGITNDLTVETGYHLRIDIADLPRMFENFSMNP